MENNIEKYARGFYKMMVKPSRYRLPMKAEAACEMLQGAWRAVVQSRGGTFILTENAAEAISCVADWMTTGKQPWITLSGGLGNGKTSMLMAISLVVNKVVIRDGNGDFYRFRKFNAKELVDTDAGAGWKRAASYNFIGIDDVGNEPPELLEYGNTITPIADLIMARYENMQPMVMTTNMDVRNFRELYGDRAYDRLHELSRVVVFKDKSFR